MFIPILLGVVSLALFILNSQMGSLLAKSINYGDSQEIYLFGSIWLGLLGISIILAVASIKEFIEYNEHRPRKPLRNK